MFETPITVPDKISTLELSKIWFHKAFQSLKTELEQEIELEPDEPTTESSEDSSNGG
jgi:hypothetical protein